MWEHATWLYVPATKTHWLPEATRTADAVVVDLEDATHPSQRAAARRALVESLAQPPPVPVVVRVNPVGSDDFRRDIEALTPLVHGGFVAGVRLAKVEGVDDVRAAAAATSDWGGTPRLICLLESATAVMTAPAIAASAGVHSIMLGEADLRASLGLPPGRDGEPGLLASRQAVVLASRAAGLPAPVGSAYTNVRDQDELAETTRYLRSLGYYGRSCLHPRQVPVVRDIFAPTARELDWARRVVAEVERREVADSASLALADGSFVDPAIVRQARTILDRRAARQSE